MAYYDIIITKYTISSYTFWPQKVILWVNEKFFWKFKENRKSCFLEAQDLVIVDKVEIPLPSPWEIYKGNVKKSSLYEYCYNIAFTTFKKWLKPTYSTCK